MVAREIKDILTKMALPEKIKLVIDFKREFGRMPQGRIFKDINASPLSKLEAEIKKQASIGKTR